VRDDPAAAAATHRLQAVLAAAAQEARATQTLLQDAMSTFASTSQQVVSVVGGSAQRIDQDMVQSLQDALRRSRSAIDALGAAGSATRTIG